MAPHAPEARDRRAGRTQRAAATREAARRAERRRRQRTIAMITALVLLVAGGIAVQAARSTSDGPSGTPAGTLADGFGVPLGAKDAPVTVEVYEDFLCPACEQFERAAGAELREMAAEGRVRVVYRPLAFLDGYSTTRYSTRALNAAGCALEAGRFPEMHDALFGAQPPEGGPGLTDSRLIALGTQAGVTGGDFDECVRDLHFERWTQQATEAASKAGVNRTPSVAVDGEWLSEPSLTTLREAVAAAG